MLSTQTKIFLENITNICSHFIDKTKNKCYDDSTNVGFENQNNHLVPIFNNHNFCFTHYKKEDMNRQEKLTALLKHLAATPNSDEHIQFVLQLAEESITVETLKNLIKISLRGKTCF